MAKAARYLLLHWALLALALLVSCGGDDGQESKRRERKRRARASREDKTPDRSEDAERERQETRKLTFAVVPKADVPVFWPAIRRGAEAAGRGLGAAILWRGPRDETAVVDQIGIVEAMIEARADGIVLAPLHPEALAPAVERAARAGIPVVIVDSGIRAGQHVSFVATDNYQGGVLGAQRLAEILGGKDNVALITNIPGATSTEERERGFRETIAGQPALRLVAERNCAGSAAMAHRVASAILAAHPDLSGIFAVCEPATVGVVNAARAAGRAGKVKLVGFDASREVVAAIRDGTLDSTVVQDPFRMGFQAVQALHDHIRGQDVPKRLVTPCRLVTKENVDTEEIQELLAAYAAAKERPPSSPNELVNGKVFTLLTLGRDAKDRDVLERDARYLNAYQQFRQLGLQAVVYRDRSGRYRLCARGFAAKGRAERERCRAAIRGLRDSRGQRSYYTAGFFAP